MKTGFITNGLVWTENGFRDGINVRVDNGIILEMGAGLKPDAREDVIDLAGGYLAPGFVDVHTHAFQGHDTMEGEDAVRRMSRSLYRIGVAAFLPTTMSASAADTKKAVADIFRVMDKPEEDAADILGVHMEAPFLNPAKKGAQIGEHLMKPDMKAYLDMCSGQPERVRLLTLAPELDEGFRFIRGLAGTGTVISAGHTDADDETVHAAADAGLTHVTHTFNAQSPIHHRKPGVPGAALTDDRLYCEMICDGIHLHPDIVMLILRAKGPEKAVAITDSMEAAGLGDGDYTLGGQKVHVSGGEARLSDGTLAGSVLTMLKAFQNLIAWGIAPSDAVRVTCLTPAESIGAKAYGRISVGAHAGMNVFDREFRLVRVL